MRKSSYVVAAAPYVFLKLGSIVYCLDIANLNINGMQ